MRSPKTTRFRPIPERYLYFYMMQIGNHPPGASRRGAAESADLAAQLGTTLGLPGVVLAKHRPTGN
jgi:hypothetical protein